MAILKLVYIRIIVATVLNNKWSYFLTSFNSRFIL